MENNKKQKLSPVKQFIQIFMAIHIVGIGLNAIFYILKIPSGIEKIINSSPLHIGLTIICYIVFNVMLYTIIKIRFLISEK
ncbi:hypothetical protein JJB27_03585 [Campylobacter fetus subsp. venerealis]|uniref:hypothetical protein n=1 Tax=Campylobacter fetus TaxID=196 RepID=UPI000818A46B|nr:hypothetical protein [Campylobacter fetus]MBK3498158.1 hypothetical protein [Campylobacter fetus subsp. venerealis]MBK3502210.1 hypothetical protein [Campylobacter fetus subsp. venerealis]OCS16795.1 hypothetical protein CfvWBT01109_01800 [Campylobacter fetus subsp. venerealis]